MSSVIGAVLYYFVRFFKMVYQLFYLSFRLVMFILHLFLYFCDFLPFVLPWMIILIGIVVVISKFIRLKVPEKKALLHHNAFIANLGGGSFDYPENSILAIKKCAKQKSPAVLLNANISACGEIVLVCDNLLLKANFTDSINKLTLKELENINISEHHPLGCNFPPERILTLGNLISELATSHVIVYLMCPPNNPKFYQSLKSQIIKNKDIFQNQFVIVTSNPMNIYLLRKEFPNLQCGLWLEKQQNIRFMNSLILNSIIGTFYRHVLYPALGISVVFIDKSEFSTQISEMWKKADIILIVYTVNSPNEKRYYQRVGCCKYLTDSLRSEPDMIAGRNILTTVQT